MLKRTKSICSILIVLLLLILLPISTMAATSGSWTPVTGVKVEVSGATDTSHDSGTVTVKAKGSDGLFGFGAKDKTATIKITNNAGAEATISCAIAKNNVNSLTASTGTLTDTAFSAKLAAGATATLTLKTAKNSTENKVVLSGFQCQIVQADAKATVTYDAAKGSVSLDGASVANGGSVAVTGGQLSAVATPASSKYEFVAWINQGTREILSTSASTTLNIPKSVNLQAVFAEKNVDNAWFAAGAAYLYDNLNDAIAKAQTLSNKVVTVYSDGVLPAGNYTIPAGVTLLIPFDSASTLVTNNAEKYLVDAYANPSEPRTEYRKLIMPYGCNLTVASGGVISIGSKIANQFLGQLGDYGAIYMDQGSNITVQEGGFLCCWGYIFHGSKGSGTVTIESNGTVYEPMSIMDYPGSSDAATGITDQAVFPMRAYTARNVEVPMTLHYGAKEYTFYCLWGNIVGTHPGYILLFGKETIEEYTPAFQFESGTKVTKSYINGTQYITIDGSISLNSMKVLIDVSIIGRKVEFSTSQTSGFNIPSGYDITLKSGTLTLNDNVIMCEGSKLTIGSNATVNTNGNNLYVLDAADDDGTVDKSNGCSGPIQVHDVHGNYYTKVDKDAVLDVNGTLIASGGFYTSGGKASIISSQGTGKIQITGSSTATSVKVRSGANTYKNISNLTSAQLQHADGSWLQSEQKTYYYYQGKWSARDTAPDMGNFITRIVLGDSLDVQFAFKASLLSKTEGNYVSVSKTFADGRNYTGFSYDYDKWETITVYGTTYYVVTFTDVSGKEMCDTITLTLMNGSTKVGWYQDSIREYVLRILNTGNYGADNNKMLVDLLYYGAAAQTYYGYGDVDGSKTIEEDELATYGLEDPQKALRTTTAPDVSTENSQFAAAEGSSVTASTTFSRLELTNGFYLHVSFNGLKKGMTAVATFKDATYPLKLGTEGKTLYFTTQEILPMSMADARETVEIEVYDGDTLVCTITDSIACYVNRVKNGTQDATGLVEEEDYENLIALLDRIMMFSGSVKQFVEPWDPAPVKEG